MFQLVKTQLAPKKPILSHAWLLPPDPDAPDEPDGPDDPDGPPPPPPPCVVKYPLERDPKKPDDCTEPSIDDELIICSPYLMSSVIGGLNNSPSSERAMHVISRVSLYVRVYILKPSLSGGGKNTSSACAHVQPKTSQLVMSNQ